jgi:hypothetical protein
MGDLRMQNLTRVLLAASLICFSGAWNVWAQVTPKPPPTAAAKKPPAAPRQGIPIIIRGAAEAKQVEAALVLAISLTFGGTQGGITQPSVDVIDPATGNVIEPGFSKLTGVSGIAATASGPVTLPFLAMYRKKSEPLRVYFKLGKGDLQLWWPAQAKPATKNQNNLVQLSDAWLASSTEQPPSPDHPAGGLSISAPKPNGPPLAFYLEFTEVKTLMPGPSVKAMGTE